MRSVRARLARLEVRTRGCSRGRCGACGWRGGDAVAYTCDPPRLMDEAQTVPHAGPSADVCPGCGRRLVYRLVPPRHLAAEATA